MRVELPKVKKARIEIIPLIDVIFFCLATFVLYTLTMNKNQELPVKLPQAQAAATQATASEPVLLTVTEGGGIYWNRDLMSDEQFRVRLAEYLREEPDPRFLINGDDRTPVGQAIVLMDQMIRLGTPRERVTFVTAIRGLPRAS
jgi:biopolymer transport protein ExbD